jgi:hypothetical protein
LIITECHTRKWEKQITIWLIRKDGEVESIKYRPLKWNGKTNLAVWLWNIEHEGIT